jgi:hypothetical protein
LAPVAVSTTALAGKHFEEDEAGMHDPVPVASVLHIVVLPQQEKVEVPHNL